MTDVTYVPDEGDLIWTDFDPKTGRDQGGRRPALVLSPIAFSRAAGFAIVCPITNTIRNFGTSVILPPGLAVSGEILTSHVGSIDILARPIRHAGGVVPAATLADVRAKLSALCGM
jgi:mRNA interferase MazF